MSRMNITHEPCTLVYTLLDPSIINFDDFSLIVRSLHSYMVDSIVPNADQNNVHVKLNYQASVGNAIQKLGSLQSAVGVTKLSSYVKESEFAHLERLRRQFAIGVPECSTDTVQPRRRVNRGRGRTFAARPPPYARTFKLPGRTEPEQQEEEEIYDDTPAEPFYTT